MKKAILELNREQFIIQIPEEIHLISKMSDFLAVNCEDNKVKNEAEQLIMDGNDVLMNYYFVMGAKIFARTDLEISQFVKSDNIEITEHVIFIKREDNIFTN